MIPLWLKEIIDKGDIPNRYDIFQNGTQFLINPKLSSVLTKYYSIQELKLKEKSKKCIAFFRDGPFLPTSTGAVTSMLGEMEALSEIGYDIYLFYCFRGWSDPALYKNQKFTTVFIKPEDFYANEKLIKGLIKTLGISICQLDSAEAVVAQASLIRPTAKVVFEVHNIEYDLLAQLGATDEEVDYIKIKELEAVKLSDLILFRSQQNQQLLEKISGEIKNSRIYRGCINSNEIKFVERVGKNRNILFLGHLNYPPNALAVNLIANQVAPKTNAKFYIAGVGPNNLKDTYKNDNITFLGRVDDLNQLFLNMEIGLAPLMSGSGTRLKILDYMAGGIPVIGTNLSVEGLEPEIRDSLIIEDDITKYPQIIDSLLNNPKLLSEYSTAGRKYVEKYRNWKSCIQDVVDGYDLLS